MNKINRLIVGLGLGLMTLFAVMPTMSTASADGYTSDGGSAGADTAGIVIGGIAVAGTVAALVGTKTSRSAPPAPAQ